MNNRMIRSTTATTRKVTAILLCIHTLFFVTCDIPFITIFGNGFGVSSFTTPTPTVSIRTSTGSTSGASRMISNNKNKNINNNVNRLFLFQQQVDQKQYKPTRREWALLHSNKDETSYDDSMIISESPVVVPVHNQPPATPEHVSMTTRMMNDKLDNDVILYNPKPVLLSAIDTIRKTTMTQSTTGPSMMTRKSSSIPSVAFGMLLFLCTLTSTLSLPLPADAAMSGGRMGGSFSRSGSSGGGSSSRMITIPRSSSSSYNGYYGGSTRIGPSTSTYYYSRPRTTFVPAPIFVPTPYYGGGGYGYGGAGPGVISYSRGPSFFDLLVFGGIAFFLINAFQNTMSNTFTLDRTATTPFWNEAAASTEAAGSSVIQFSIAMNVPNRDERSSILNVLQRLSSSSTTTNSNMNDDEALQKTIQQVCMELLRRSSSIVGASGTSKYYPPSNERSSSSWFAKSSSSSKKDFTKLAIQERMKFETEMDYSSKKTLDTLEPSSLSTSSSSSSNKATMAVVTMVLHVTGDPIQNKGIMKLQSIQSVEDVLRTIATTFGNSDLQLLDAEILWTPNDRTETLTYRDVVADYPELNSF